MSNITDVIDCGSGGGADTSFRIRIASVFVILVGSTSGALFPVLAKRSSWLRVPQPIFEFVFLPFTITAFCIHIVFKLRQIFWFWSHRTVIL